MQLIKALKSDFESIRKFYDDVIDNTPRLDKHTRWMKNGHPTNDDIKDYIDAGDMYICKNGNDIVSALALLMYQTQDYHPLNWEVDAKDDEVASLHIFGVAPKYQNQGYAKRIVKLAIEKAAKEKKKAFRLDTLECNTPAIKMYHSLGFKYIGGYKHATLDLGDMDFVFFEMAL